MHGDLKSANVLVLGQDEDYIFKLCDVGHAHIAVTTTVSNSITSANRFSHQKQSNRGTISFESPEVFLTGQKTMKSDVYAFGMMMYELLLPKYLFPWASVYAIGNAETIASLISAAVKLGERPTLSKDESNSPYGILMKMAWQQNALERPTASVLKEKIQDLYQVIITEIFK